MSLTTLARVEKVDTKTGETNGKAWKGYFLFADGTKYATFDTAIGDKALSAVGHTATIFYDKTDKGLKLENVDIASGEPAAQPVSHTKPDGDVDWDLKQLHIARTAWWKSTIEAFASADLPPDQFLAFAREIVIGAEIDTFHRAPAQAPKDDMDDIPF